MRVSGFNYLPGDEQREQEKFDKLQHFFIWGTNCDAYGDANMQPTYRDKSIIVDCEDTGQTLILNIDGTWELE